jgi:hypothetical protein
MKPRYLSVLLGLLFLGTAATPFNFPHRPMLPSEVARRTWGDSPAVGFLAGREALRAENPLSFLDYPGQRDSYNNIESGSIDTVRVDTDVYIDLDNDGQLVVEASLVLVALEEGIDKMESYLEIPEILELSTPGDFEIAYEQVGGIVKMTFSEPLPVEEETIIFYRYQGEMNCDVQFMLPTCKLNGSWKYVTHSQFLPQTDGLGDPFIGEMNLHITGKGFKEWHAGGTGTYIGSSLNPDGKGKVIRFEHIYPTGLYAWSASKMTTVHGMAGTIPISATVQSPEVDNMWVILDIMQDVLELYGEIYVTYPWNNLDLVAMPKSFSGGFGPLSTIFVLKGILNASPDNNSIYGAMQLISHETGHEWWGNLVEMADASAVVISEGLAEFSSNYHFERATGSRWGFLDNNMSYTYTVPHDEEPIMISPYVYASPYYYQIAYQKGAVIFDMLRLEIGDEMLLDGLKEFSTRFYMQYAYPGDLIEVIEEVSGVDLDYFYSQWFEGRGIIVLEVGADCNEPGGTCLLTVKQESQLGQSEFLFNLPVYVLLRDGTGFDLTLRVDDWEKEFELPVDPGQVRRIYVDHQRQLIRKFQAHLPGDLDLNGVVDGSDLVEMSFAYQLNLLVASDWGEYFYANGSYYDLADVAREEGPGQIDGRIDELDLNVLLSNLGLTALDETRESEE